MKRIKLLLVIQILLMACLGVGCTGKGEGEVIPLTYEQAIEAGMSDKFHMIIENAFGLQDNETGDVVVVGFNQNSELINGTEVDILTPNGRIPTQITSIMTTAEEKSVDCAPEASEIVATLINVTEEQIHPGDIIVLRGVGYISNELDAVVVPGLSEDEIKEGEVVYTSFNGERTPATVMLKEKPSETKRSIHLILKYENNIPFVDQQVIIIFDENGKDIGTGRVFGKEEYKIIEKNLKD